MSRSALQNDGFFGSSAAMRFGFLQFSPKAVDTVLINVVEFPACPSLRLCASSTLPLPDVRIK